ncbi:hypothetical protein M0802_005373 [Mischocyttarus mexicanus]|nr:hypothetical protein M0802_005373 [Mischocyttarus mexicanus]
MCGYICASKVDTYLLAWLGLAHRTEVHDNDNDDNDDGDENENENENEDEDERRWVTHRDLPGPSVRVRAAAETVKSLVVVANTISAKPQIQA